MGAYVFDNAWERERERLAGLEAILDPGTRRVIEDLGITSGWTCLEVAGGGGSVARWLCERVAPAGRVIATDLDTRFLDAIPIPNLDVLRHDILQDDLPEDHFDLVHSRLLVEHLHDRPLALKRMISALKPGGWLLIEDTDWGRFLARPAMVVIHPPDGTRRSVRVTRAMLKLMASAGYDAVYGRRLPEQFLAQGLVDVGAEIRSRLGWGGDPGSEAPRWTLQALRDRAVAAGLVTAAEVDREIRAFGDPTRCGFWPDVVATWGRKPGAAGAGRPADAALARRIGSGSERLRALPIFSSCAEGEIERVASLAHEVEVPAGHVLTREGDPGASFFVVETGTATVTHEGRRVASLGPGSFFGEIALVEGGPRTATVTAEAPMRLFAFEVHTFSALMREVPSVAERVLEAVAERKRGLEGGAGS